MAESGSPTPSLEERLRRATRARFEVLEPIGRGGMASVFRARDLGLGREVALKVLSDEVLGDESSIDRFLEEARAVAALDHPNIVKVFSVERHDDVHFLVLELVHGSSLAQVLRRGRLLDVGMVKRWFAQIADAMDYSHRRGIVHRDIKPGNVLIRDTGEAVLTDFGIAKAATTPNLTRTGFLVGTPDYMSPEQCGGDPDRVGPASDQYALGIVLYEALSGRNPFSGRGDQMLALSKQLEAVAPPLTTVRAEVPEDLAAALARMLAKDPTERFESVSAAARAAGCLLPRMDGRGAGEGGRQGPPVASGPVAAGGGGGGVRPGRRRTVRWLLLGAPVAVGALALALNLPRTPGGETDGDRVAEAGVEAPVTDSAPDTPGVDSPSSRPGGEGPAVVEEGPRAAPGGATAGRSPSSGSRASAASGALALGDASEIVALLDLADAPVGERWCAALDVAVNDGELEELLRRDVVVDASGSIRVTAGLDGAAEAASEAGPLSAIQAEGRVRLWRGDCGSSRGRRGPDVIAELAPVCAQRLLSGAWFPCR